MVIVMTLGERIASIRKELGYSQSKLSEITGIPLPSIRGYEQDHREPSLRPLIKLSSALGMKIDELLEGVDFQEE